MKILNVTDCYDGLVFIEIKGGDQNDCIGDEVWINEQGTELLISDTISCEALSTLVEQTPRSERKTLLGILRKAEVYLHKYE